MADLEHYHDPPHELKDEEIKELLQVKGNGEKREDLTLVEALNATGFGKYSYLAILTAGVNIAGCVCASMQMSYVLPATDCDLNLTTGQKGVLSTMMITGMIFTSHFTGYLADEYGRKYVSMRSNLVSSLLTFLSALSPNFITLVVISFLNGAVTSGVIIPAYVLLGETIPNEYRSMSTLSSGGIGNTGFIIIPGLAIFLIPLSIHWDIFGYFTFSSWRLLLMATSVVSLIGSALFLTLYESPKYLLTKGHGRETLEVLQNIYSMNTGKPKTEYALSKPPRLDDNEIENTTSGGLKRIWTQTAILFHKPLLSKTVMACAVQAGMIGISNIYLLWLPQILTKLLNYSGNHPDFGVTMCYVVQSNESTSNSSQALEECVVNVPVDTYYALTMMGISQLSFFTASGYLSKITGDKSLLVSYIWASAVLSFVLTFLTNVYGIIVAMMAAGVILGSCIPVTIGMLMDLFPTSVRSTASCIGLLSGRIATTLLTQMMGLLQEDYCDVSYWGVGLCLGCLGLLALVFLKEASKNG